MNALTMPVVAMILAAQPRLFRHAHAASGESRPLIKLIGLLTFTWGLLSALILVLGARFLPVVLGGAYSEAAALLPWVAMAAPFLSLRIAAGNILVALGRPLERLGYELGGIAILIIGAFSLSPLIGTKGLIVGIVCAEAIMACGGWVMIRSHTKPKRI
jgi:O-antigen/teichoic acid export membrane protein